MGKENLLFSAYRTSVTKIETIQDVCHSTMNMELAKSYLRHLLRGRFHFLCPHYNLKQKIAVKYGLSHDHMLLFQKCNEAVYES